MLNTLFHKQIRQLYPIPNKICSNNLIISEHFFFFKISVESQSLTNTVHKTQAAAEKHNDMWCYTCHTMDSGDMCVENITANYSSFMKKCRDEEYTCMVQRFSYTTSTENSTSSPKMWSLERKCTAHCESGCIVIGERTKLYACTSCCKTPFCNSGRSVGQRDRPFHLWTLLAVLMMVTLAGTASNRQFQWNCGVA